MKHIILLLFIFSYLNSNSQKPTSESDLNKMLKGNKELQKQMKENPEFAKAMKDAMQQVDEEENAGAIATKAPKKQVARLASIPSKTLSKAELVEWSKKSYASLMQKLSVSEKSKFNAALEACGNNPKNIEDAAILNWIQKSPKGALLFAFKAVQVKPEEPLFWNNLAGILNLTGNQEKAIPPLNYILKLHPGSSTIFNNLGQAYFGLGDINNAKKYFDSCLKKDPDHPEANHSMGLIYRFAGNTIKSNYHFEKETRVCYKKPVVEELRSNKSEEELFKITRAKFVKPENYFTKLGLHNFVVPKLPASVDESNKLYQAHIDFRENVQNEIKKWAQIDTRLVMDDANRAKKGMKEEKGIYSDLVETVFLTHLEKEKQKNIISWMTLDEKDIGHITFPTDGSIATRDGQARTKKYGEDLAKLRQEHAYENNENDIKRLAEERANPNNSEYIRNKWEKIKVETDIKYCKKEIALADKYLSENATNQPKGFERRTASIIQLLNEAFSYKALAPKDVNVALQAHNLLQVYLVYLDAYAASIVIAGTPKNGQPGNGVSIYCDMDALEAEKYQLESTTFIEAKCAFKISIPLVVAKVSFNCEKIEVEGGEIIIVNAEYEFKSGNTTLAAGPGVSIDLPFISAGTKHQAYVTFDRDGNYSDSGVKGEAGVEVTGSVEIIEAGEILKEAGIGATLEAKATYNVSVHSGASAQIEAGGKEIPIEF